MVERGSTDAVKQDDDGCQIVSLDLDEARTCLLCARVRDAWFYVEVRPEQIKNKDLLAEYTRLIDGTLQQRKRAEEEVEGLVEAVEAQQQVDHEVDDSDAVESPANGHAQDEDVAEGDDSSASDAASPGTPENGNHDSGYPSDSMTDSDAPKREDNSSTDFEEQLRSLLLEALFPSLDKHAPKPPTAKNSANHNHRTLSGWFNAPIHCLSLHATRSSTHLTPHARPDLDGQAYITQHLIPSMALPKYLRNLSNVAWYHPDSLRVLDTAHDIHAPLHPTTIVPIDPKHPHSDASGTANECVNEQLFLKLAPTDAAPSVKREIRLLHTLARHDLHARGLRAPKLMGLVAVPTPQKNNVNASSISRTHIMGFLLSMIPQPARPLTEYMSEAVPAKKRERWAREAEDMVRILHEAGIVWGDAKGDNFFVSDPGCDIPGTDDASPSANILAKDAEAADNKSVEDDDGKGTIHIIDFGGGFTGGWVDEKLANTMDGDDEGTGRLVNGLRDPVGGVVGVGDVAGARVGGDEEEDEENEENEDEENEDEAEVGEESEEDDEEDEEAATDRDATEDDEQPNPNGVAPRPTEPAPPDQPPVSKGTKRKHHATNNDDGMVEPEVFRKKLRSCA